MPVRQPRLHVTALSTVCLALASAGAAEAATVTRSFSPTDSAQSYVVPAGVTAVDVIAVGGRGGSGGGPLTGGKGARVTGRLTVTPGGRLWVLVGGNGTAPDCEQADPGGWNGGASGGTGSCYDRGGSGGGASDIRVCEPGGPCDADPGVDPLGRLLVAGGGGGASRTTSQGSAAGGDAGAPGGSTPGGRGTAGGGGAGTPTAGGTPGSSADTSVAPQWLPLAAEAGTLGAGGVGGTGRAGGYIGGGGGGGGLYGGGGGGSGNYYAAAGGGGSSLVPAVAGTLETADVEPIVTVSYDVGEPAALDAPTVEDAAIYADGSSTTTVTVVARDEHGVAAAGADVTFAATGPQPQFGPTTDNGDGSYTATVTAASARGTAAITARLASADQTSAPVSLQQVDRPTVTSPDDGTPVLDASGGPGRVTVAGTADALTTAVDVACVTRSGVVALADAQHVPVANGRWSVAGVVLPDSASGNVHCRLVAIATGVEEPDAEALPGPSLRRVGLDRNDSPLGLLTYNGTTGGPSGEATFSTFGQGCGLVLTPFVDRRFGTGMPWLGCGAALTSELDERPALVVDGRSAFTAGSASNADDELENPPTVTLDTRIAADGSFVVTESGPVRRCAATSGCSRLVATGVTATVRTWIAPSGASGSRTVDFASVDGASHDVTVTLHTAAGFESAEMRQGDETTWSTHESWTRTTNAPVRHSVQIRSTDDAEAPALAVTAVPGPSLQVAREGTINQRFTRTVPAGGVAGVAMRFDLSDPDGIADVARTARDGYAVGVEIATPDAGTSTEAAAVTLTGTALDRSGDVALRVAGQSTAVAADGSWTAAVPLSVGQNTVEAVVESRYGVRETATVTVTRTVPAPPIDQGPPTYHPPVTPGGPTPPAAPTPAPQLLRKLTVPKRVRLAQVRKRGLSIPLTLNATGARITAELRGPSGVFARGTASQAKRGTTTLRLKPTRKAAAKAAKALRRATSKTVRLRLKLTVRDADGATQSVTRTIQLRR